MFNVSITFQYDWIKQKLFTVISARFFTIMTSLFFCNFFSIFELILWLSIVVQTFVAIGPQTTKIMPPPPPKLNMSKTSPAGLGLRTLMPVFLSWTVNLSFIQNETKPVTHCYILLSDRSIQSVENKAIMNKVMLKIADQLFLELWKVEINFLLIYFSLTKHSISGKWKVWMEIRL